MNIMVIGGSGLIGTKLVARLQDDGHAVMAASPRSGVDTLTGKGLTEAVADADVVVDVANSPSLEDVAALDFFERSSRNLLVAETVAGVRHHVALSVVGTERLQTSGYFRAKLAQETLIKASGMPYTIVRATQFFEFLGSIALSSMADGKVHLSPAQVQPIAANDVADILAEVAVSAPANGTIEIAGPERVGLDRLVRRYFAAARDHRDIVRDPGALYFGAEIDDHSLTPGDAPRLAATNFNTWFGQSPG